MKYWLNKLLVVVMLIATQSCEKTEIDYMNSIPKGLHLLKRVNTYYTDNVVVDTFYYNSNYEIICLERRDGDLKNRFYFEDQKLRSQIINIKKNDTYVSYEVSYLADETLAVTNDTTAYFFSDPDSGYYKRLTCMTRAPFGEWEEKYICEYEWKNGNLSSASVDRVVTYFNYDDKFNPMAGYAIWGNFFDDLFMGTNNNRIKNEYHYEYNSSAYPIRLSAPDYYREYFYHQAPDTTSNIK
jgi:hypothetical protein